MPGFRFGPRESSSVSTPHEAGIVTVAGAGRRRSAGTLNSVLKQAGLKNRRAPDALPRCDRTGRTSFGAYVPDLPGCVAAGETRDEALSLIREAIEFHIEGLRQEEPACSCSFVTGEVVDVQSCLTRHGAAGSILATHSERQCAGGLIATPLDRE